MVNRTPKRRAAFVGLSFMVMILAALFADFVTTAKVLLGIIMVFAALESLAALEQVVMCILI